MCSYSNNKEIMRLSKLHGKEAVKTLVNAFWNYPALQYFFPDEIERERIAHCFFSLPIFYSIRYGEVYATSKDLEGIAIWLLSDNYPFSTWKLLRSVPLPDVIGLGRYGAGRMRNLGKYLDTVHSRLAPFEHWFLQSIGVDPRFQGNGYASKLIRTMLSRIDNGHLPCYLDTLQEQNVQIYRHFGFKVLEESNVPGTSLTNWAMLRDAR